jgi:hypothetical protein
MPELIHPTLRLRDSWLDARDEWGRDCHQPGWGLHRDDEVDTEAGFPNGSEGSPRRRILRSRLLTGGCMQTTGGSLKNSGIWGASRFAMA